jgi:hypothetical protein
MGVLAPAHLILGDQRCAGASTLDAIGKALATGNPTRVSGG